eukprot:2947845-Pyramimonas_sp.AAC.1
MITRASGAGGATRAEAVRPNAATFSAALSVCARKGRHEICMIVGTEGGHVTPPTPDFTPPTPDFTRCV